MEGHIAGDPMNEEVRCHLFKQQLRLFSERSGLAIRVAHFPPGCSKWNYIEHRLFPHVTRAMSGTVFETHEQVSRLIERASTKTGLTVRAYVLPGDYPTGEKVPSSYFECPPAIHDSVLGDFNYHLVPEDLWPDLEPYLTN